MKKTTALILLVGAAILMVAVLVRDSSRGPADAERRERADWNDRLPEDRLVEERVQEREARRVATPDPASDPVRAQMIAARDALEQVYAEDPELSALEARLRSLAERREALANGARRIRREAVRARNDRLLRVEEEFAPRLAEREEPIAVDAEDERSRLAREFEEARTAAREQGDSEMADRFAEAERLENDAAALVQEMSTVAAHIRERRAALQAALPDDHPAAGLSEAVDQWKTDAAARSGRTRPRAQRPDQEARGKAIQEPDEAGSSQ